MNWVAILAIMFTAKVLLLLAALPVAFVFCITHSGGSYLIFGGIPGLEQMVRNEQVSVAQFSLVPIPLFVLMGEVLFHSGLALKSCDGSWVTHSLGGQNLERNKAVEAAVASQVYAAHPSLANQVEQYVTIDLISAAAPREELLSLPESQSFLLNRLSR